MDEKTAFRTKDAAAFLSISTAHLRRLSQNGVIKSSKPGGKLLYFQKKDLQDYLCHNRKGGINE